MIKRICEFCAKEFAVFPSRIGARRGIYCSHKCLGHAHKGENSPNWRNKIKKICKTCGKEFYIIHSRDVKGGGKCCSKKCDFIARRKKIKRTCLICGAKFLAYPSQIKIGGGKYCSHKCFEKSNRGEGSSLWKGGNKKRICEQCGKEFYTKPCEVKRGRGKFCSIKCYGHWISIYKVGKNNPTWQGGKSFEPYTLEFNRELKEKIRAEYNYKCIECGMSQKELGYKLSIHHIDYNKKNNQENNLLPLCKSCHSQTNFSRENWTNYYKRKINSVFAKGYLYVQNPH